MEQPAASVVKVHHLLNYAPDDDNLHIFKNIHTYFENSMVYELLF
jgi:hypothetical protein